VRGWPLESLYGNHARTPSGRQPAIPVISNGFLTGLSQCWYTNGQLQVRESFNEGVSNGLREKWYENGARQSQACIVAGKIIGTFQSWYNNGQLAEQIEMQRGQPDGTAWAYYPSGFLKAKTTVKEGKVLDRRSWEDGQQRPTSVTANVPLNSTVN
jgi:antitoxin component YwqK of YwqJK toxin-antitoxin module